MRAKTCCFTGHRHLPLTCIHKIRERTELAIRDLIDRCGVKYFGVGGALGYDTLAAEVLLNLRDSIYPDIKVILVQPFEGFESRWSEEQQRAYKMSLPKYDKRVCVSSVASRDAYLARNRHLVDHSAYCIAYCTEYKSGTAYTVDYARRKNLQTINIADLIH